MLKKLVLPLVAALTPMSLSAAEFMDAAWAKQACNAWNADPVLTAQLMTIPSDDGNGYSWVGNDAGRGFKLVQMYRTQCKETSKIQLNIAVQGGKAMCVYGGAPDGKAMNFDVDYLMHANDKDWTCMGEGKFGCGAMGAMMTGKLKFQGPKMEAMKVMDPFENFLQLTGKVAGNKGECQP